MNNDEVITLLTEDYEQLKKENEGLKEDNKKLIKINKELHDIFKDRQKLEDILTQLKATNYGK